MPPAGFGPVIPASERPRTQALDRAATGTGSKPSKPYILDTVVRILHRSCLTSIALYTLNYLKNCKGRGKGGMEEIA